MNHRIERTAKFTRVPHITVVTGYTPNYEVEASGLIRTLHDHEYSYLAYAYDSATDAHHRHRWLRNTAYKATIVHDAIQHIHHGHRLVWLDADSRVLQPLAWLETEMLPGFAAPRLKHQSDTLASGTVAFDNLPEIRALIDDWKQRCDSAPLTKWDQVHLRDAVLASTVEWQEIPLSYVIMHNARQKDPTPDTVVWHRQASRNGPKGGSDEVTN